MNSEFEKVFGTTDKIMDMIATIRDMPEWDITKYIPAESAIADPECVLFAIYKYIQEGRKINE